MKYLKINYDFTINKTAGMGHMFNNVINILITCYIKNIIPIIPVFSLGNIHCKQPYTNFSEFFDYSKLKINNIPFKVILNEDNILDKDNIYNLNITSLKQYQLRWHPFFKLDNNYNITVNPSYVKNSVDIFNYLNIYNCYNNNKTTYDNYKKPDFTTLKNIHIYLPFKNNIINIGDKIIEKYLSNNYICIHARRGDDVNILKSANLDHLNKYTESKHILEKIKTLNIKNVYIMMHPMNKQNYNKSPFKNSNFNIIFSEDIEEFENIELNNLLYCIESYIMSKSIYKISTYRHWSNKFGEQKIYNDYLTNFDSKFENDFSFPYLYYN